jgi:hypothetical protein
MVVVTTHLREAIHGQVSPHFLNFSILRLDEGPLAATAAPSDMMNNVRAILRGLRAFAEKRAPVWKGR